MVKLILNLLFITLTIFKSSSLLGQEKNQFVISDDLTFEFKNDTLYSNHGLKLFAGKKLLIGAPAGELGRFRSILSNAAAIVPSIWGQDKRYENAIENYVDSKKNRQIVKEDLIPGNFLTIRKIRLWKNSKPNFYLVYLTSDSNKFGCDIRLALILKELLLQQ